MIKLSTFHLLNKRTQFFLTTRSNLKFKENLVNDILVDHTPSLVGIFNDSKLIIKFIRARSWHEYLKLLWNHSRITKEVEGSNLLTKLGLRVPEIHEVGYGIIPNVNHEFLGYYVMENLIQSGFQELSKLIKEDTLNEALRGIIMKSIYDGLKSMRDNHIVFSDFHLDNVFANSRGEIVWIDAGVTTYRSFNTKKFTKKHNHSISRYINYSYSGQQLLLPPERTMFSSLLLPIE